MTQVVIDLPDELAQRLSQEAQRLGQPVEERVILLLEDAVAPARNFHLEVLTEGLAQLRGLLQQIPGLTVISTSAPEEPYWWVKLCLDLQSRIVWHIIQELGFVLNNISVEERLPTVFMPLSPPPYLNGGPEEFLTWVIETSVPFSDAGAVAEILAERLPNPLGDEERWLNG
ncbi:MAG TPA: hypothetical protein VH599_13985 [Ktedonobacterales bacterium]|jgi:hypothetical protein